MAQPVRARVELLLVCRVLDSSANLCVLPRPVGGDAFDDEEDVEGLFYQSVSSRATLPPWTVHRQVTPSTMRKTYRYSMNSLCKFALLGGIYGNRELNLHDALRALKPALESSLCVRCHSAILVRVSQNGVSRQGQLHQGVVWREKGQPVSFRLAYG